MSHSTRPRLALFSPMPPARTGVAAVSAELAPALRSTFDISVFADLLPARSDAAAGIRSAHDFLWLHAQRPYDLTIHQLGNSASHDFIWPYAFRFPGLIVFHDACLHHARAALLLRAGRRADYRAEFAANHPGDSSDLAEMAVAGYDSRLFYRWPMRRLLIQRARAVGAHTRPLAEQFTAETPTARIHLIRLAHGQLIEEAARARRRRDARRRLGLTDDARVFGVFGGLSPEKRVPQILRAFAAVHALDPKCRLILAGEAAAHYRLQTDLERFGVQHAAIVTGYVESDETLTDLICACDAALTLRWPSAGEVSGPWLRCLAAATPTVITQLPHLVGIPWLDPRTWSRAVGVPSSEDASGASSDPDGACCVAVDILDEDHSLLLAMRRLARDGALRDRLGRAGQRYWVAHHAPPLMLEDYERAIADALAHDAPDVALPAHLVEFGTRVLDATVARFGLPDPLG